MAAHSGNIIYKNAHFGVRRLNGKGIENYDAPAATCASGTTSGIVPKNDTMPDTTII